MTSDEATRIIDAHHDFVEADDRLKFLYRTGTWGEDAVTAVQDYVNKRGAFQVAVNSVRLTSDGEEG